MDHTHLIDMDDILIRHLQFIVDQIYHKTPAYNKIALLIEET